MLQQKKKEYIISIQPLNNNVSLNKGNIKLPENRKLYESKPLSKYSNVNFKLMPIYQTDDNSILQIKEKKLHR